MLSRLTNTTCSSPECFPSLSTSSDSMQVLDKCRPCAWLPGLHVFCVLIRCSYTMAGSITREPCHVLSLMPPARQPPPLLRLLQLYNAEWLTVSISRLLPSSARKFSRAGDLRFRCGSACLPTLRQGPHAAATPCMADVMTSGIFQTVATPVCKSESSEAVLNNFCRRSKCLRSKLGNLERPSSGSASYYRT